MKMLKRILFVATVAIGCLLPSLATAETWDDGNVVWRYFPLEGSTTEARLGDGSNACVAVTAEGGLTLPNQIGQYKVTTLSANAFAGCAKITGVTLPENLETVEEGAFDGASALKSIDVSKRNENFLSVNGALYADGGWELVRVPEGLVSKEFNGLVRPQVGYVRFDAFRNCASIRKIAVNADSVEALMECTFAGCSSFDAFTWMEMDSCGEWFPSFVKDGVLYSDENFCELVKWPTAKPISEFESIVLTENSNFCVIDGAFAGNPLEKITIPAWMGISSWAFYDCPNLKDIGFLGYADWSCGVLDELKDVGINLQKVRYPGFPKNMAEGWEELFASLKEDDPDYYGKVVFEKAADPNVGKTNLTIPYTERWGLLEKYDFAAYAKDLTTLTFDGPCPDELRDILDICSNVTKVVYSANPLYRDYDYDWESWMSAADWVTNEFAGVQMVQGAVPATPQWFDENEFGGSEICLNGLEVGWDEEADQPICLPCVWPMPEGEVVIPDEIAGLPVLGIGSYAFSGLKTSGIRSLTLPCAIIEISEETIDSLGDWKDLEEIRMSEPEVGGDGPQPFIPRDYCAYDGMLYGGGYGLLRVPPAKKGELTIGKYNYVMFYGAEPYWGSLRNCRDIGKITFSTGGDMETFIDAGQDLTGCDGLLAFACAASGKGSPLTVIDGAIYEDWGDGALCLRLWPNAKRPLAFAKGCVEVNIEALRYVTNPGAVTELTVPDDCWLDFSSLAEEYGFSGITKLTFEGYPCVDSDILEALPNLTEIVYSQAPWFAMDWASVKEEFEGSGIAFVAAPVPSETQVHVEDGCLQGVWVGYDEERDEDIYVAPFWPKPEGELVIPANVREIRSGAFTGLDKVTKLVLPRNLECIEEVVGFETMSALEAIEGATRDECRAFGLAFWCADGFLYDAKGILFRVPPAHAAKEFVFDDYISWNALSGCHNIRKLTASAPWVLSDGLVCGGLNLRGCDRLEEFGCLEQPGEDTLANYGYAIIDGAVYNTDGSPCLCLWPNAKRPIVFAPGCAGVWSEALRFVTNPQDVTELTVPGGEGLDLWCIASEYGFTGIVKLTFEGYPCIDSGILEVMPKLKEIVYPQVPWLAEDWTSVEEGFQDLGVTFTAAPIPSEPGWYGEGGCLEYVWPAITGAAEVPEGICDIYENAFADMPTLTELTFPTSLCWLDSGVRTERFNKQTMVSEKLDPPEPYSPFPGCMSLAKLVFRGDVPDGLAETLENVPSIREVVYRNMPWMRWGDFIDEFNEGHPGTPVKFTVLDEPEELVWNIQGGWLYGEYDEESGWRVPCVWPDLVGAVEVPDGVGGIGDFAFACMSNLTAMTLPASVASVGPQTFADCVSLKKLMIRSWCAPDGLKDVLAETPSVAEVVYDSANWRDWRYFIGEFKAEYPERKIVFTAEPEPSEPQWSVEWGNARLHEDGILYGEYDAESGFRVPCVWPDLVGAAEVPEGVAEIGEYAFACMSNLTAMTLPASVTFVDSLAFTDCVSLKKLVIRGAYEPDGLQDLREALPSLEIVHEAPNWYEIGGGCEINLLDYAYEDDKGEIRMVWLPEENGLMSEFCEEAGLELNFPRRGTLTFEYKVESSVPGVYPMCWTSEGDDYLEIDVEGTSPGDPGWQKASFEMSEPDSLAGISMISYIGEPTRLRLRNFKWADVPETVTITLDPTLGKLPDGQAAQLTLRTDGTFGELPVPVREGCEFAGWGRIGGGEPISPDTLVPLSDTTLVAKWDVPLEVVVNPNGDLSDLVFNENNGWWQVNSWESEVWNFDFETGSPTNVHKVWREHASYDGEVDSRSTVEAFSATFSGAGTLKFGELDGDVSVYYDWMNRRDPLVFVDGEPAEQVDALGGGKSVLVKTLGEHRLSISFENRSSNDVFVNLTLGAITFTAAPAEVEVTFDFEDGSADFTKTYKTGVAYGELPVPAAREGHEFLGWFTAAWDGRKVEAMELVDFSVTNLFAHWSTDLGTALDSADLRFTSGGPTGWAGQSGEARVGITAAASGFLDYNETNTLSTTVAGKGVLSFWWKTDAGSLDLAEVNLSLAVDGRTIWLGKPCGKDGWYNFALAITNDGPHTVTWSAALDSEEYNEWAAFGFEMPTLAETVADFRAYVDAGLISLSGAWVDGVTWAKDETMTDAVKWGDSVLQAKRFLPGEADPMIAKCDARIKADANDYEAHIRRAIARLKKLGEDEVFAQLLARYGYRFSGELMAFVGELDVTDAPLSNDAVDAVAAEALPALADILADLETVPEGWTGCVALSPAEYPVDEPVYVDFADVALAKAAVHGAKAAILAAQGYDLTVDNQKMYEEIVAASNRVPLAVGKFTGDWAACPVSRMKGFGMDGFAQVAADGKKLLVRLTLPENLPAECATAECESVALSLTRDAESLYVGFDLRGEQKGGYYIDVNRGTAVTLSEFAVTRTITGNVCDLQIDLSPFDEIRTLLAFQLENALQTWGDLGVEDVFGTTIEVIEPVFELESNGCVDNPDLMIEALLAAHPQFAASIRDQASLDASKAEVRMALGLYGVFDTAIRSRKTDVLHFFEYDEKGAAKWDAMAKAAKLALASLDEVVTVKGEDFACFKGFKQTNLNERVTLKPFFDGRIGRWLLPPFDGDRPYLRAIPDITFAGTFPDWTMENRMEWLLKIDGVWTEPVVPVVVTNTITYLNLQGAVNTNVTEFTDRDLPLALGPVEREGWRFLGWTPNDGVISVGTSTNVTFTAMWTEAVEELKLQQKALLVSEEVAGPQPWSDRVSKAIAAALKAIDAATTRAAVSAAAAGGRDAIGEARRLDAEDAELGGQIPGSELVWEFVDGTLYIDGEGAMPALTRETAPWSNSVDKIECVSIGKDVLSVCDGLFSSELSAPAASVIFGTDDVTVSLAAFANADGTEVSTAATVLFLKDGKYAAPPAWIGDDGASYASYAAAIAAGCVSVAPSFSVAPATVEEAVETAPAVVVEKVSAVDENSGQPITDKTGNLIDVEAVAENVNSNDVPNAERIVATEVGGLTEVARELAREGENVREVKLTVDAVPVAAKVGVKQESQLLMFGAMTEGLKDAVNFETKFAEISLLADGVPVHDSPGLIKISIPQETRGRTGFSVARIHDGAVQLFREIFDEADAADLTFRVGDGKIDLWSEKFSDYAIGSMSAETPVRTVAFDANGGSASEPARRVDSGSAVGGLPTAIRTGYAFLGWFTEAAGGTPVTAATVVKADVTFYAHWKPNAYAVRFDSNGGEGTMSSQAFVYGEAQELRANAFTREGWEFAGWATSADGAVKYADGATVRNLTAAADGVVTLFAVWRNIGPAVFCEIAAEYRTKADLGVVPVKVVNVDEAVKIAVKGLPSGVKFTAKDVKATAKSAAVSANSIYGAPTKSGVYAATVTVTPTDKKSKMAPIVKTLMFVVRNAGEHIVRADCDAAQGTVKGLGVYAPVKKVTLKATAAKGYVFSGWYDGDALISRLASYVLTMPDKDVKVAARFVTVAADKGSIALAVTAGETDIVQTKSITVKLGMPVEWPVAASALSATTVKVSGLPSGLKFTAKDVMKKGSKTEVEIPANTIYGTPKTASKTDKNGNVTPSKVKITVTTAGKAKQEYVLTVTVRGIPAEGTFNGGSANGLVTLTVAKTGKISGKYLADGKTWTLSAAGFDTWDDDDRLTATLTAKSGKEVKTVALAYEDGYVCASLTSGQKAASPLWEAWRNEWKTEPQKSLAATLKGLKVTVGENGNIVLTVGASGAVTAKGTFGSYSASCSTVLIPTESKGTYVVYLYFPPKAGKFAGWTGIAELVWDGYFLQIR